MSRQERNSNKDTEFEQIRDIKKVTVIGAGMMGHGIAQLASVAGFEVIIHDVEQSFLDKGIQKIKWSLNKLSEKNKLTKDQVDNALARIRTTTDLKSAVSQSDLVIEAVPEVLALKTDVFARIDHYAPADAILATNTSSIPIDELAKVTKRGGNVVGTHYFYPPQVMSLLEIVRGTETSDRTVKSIESYAKMIGKETIVCEKSVPGFIVDNILDALLRCALKIVEAGKAIPEEIDSALQFKVGFPMGIFEVVDYGGVDIDYNMQKFYKSQGYAQEVSPLLKDLVESGRLGAKTGQGFYEWKNGSRPRISEEAGRKFDIRPIIANGVNRAAELIAQEVATKEDVDTGVKLGLGYPRGILEMGDNIGLDEILDSLTKFCSEYKPSHLIPSPLLEELVKNNHLGKKTGRGFYVYDHPSVKLGDFDSIRVEIEPDSGIVWMFINRPSKLNTITSHMMADLSSALDLLERNERAKVIIITGEGEKAFSAGADVLTLRASSTYSAAELGRQQHLFLVRLENSSRPIIASIRGYCLGGGCELSLACDFRIAAASAQIGLPEINLGVIPGWGGTQRMTRLLGIAKTKELVMLAQRISAEEAMRIGLVNKVVSDKDLDREVREFATKLALGPSIALSLAKKSINIAGGIEPLGGVGFEIEALSSAIAEQTEDAKEGEDAFFSKRKPSFKSL